MQSCTRSEACSLDNYLRYNCGCIASECDCPYECHRRPSRCLTVLKMPATRQGIHHTGKHGHHQPHPLAHSVIHTFLAVAATFIHSCERRQTLLSCVMRGNGNSLRIIMLAGTRERRSKGPRRTSLSSERFSLPLLDGTAILIGIFMSLMNDNIDGNTTQSLSVTNPWFIYNNTRVVQCYEPFNVNK